MIEIMVNVHRIMEITINVDHISDIPYDGDNDKLHHMMKIHSDKSTQNDGDNDK